MRAQRWQRRKGERTPEILEAALACFAEKGFAASRMDEIAARAGITKGTIYLYFESKEAVFKSLAHQSIGTQLNELKLQVDGFKGPTAELLSAVITTVGQFARTSDRVILPKVLLAEVSNFPQLAEFWRQEIIDQGIGLFESIIRRGIARGELRAIPTQHAARLCIGPIVVMILWRTIFAKFDTEPYDYEGLIQAHIEVLLQGLEIKGAKA